MATFIGSSLQGKCLGSLFHYTQHLVDPEHLDCDIHVRLTIYKSCKKKICATYNCYWTAFNFENWCCIAISRLPLTISLFPLTRDKGRLVGKYIFFLPQRSVNSKIWERAAADREDSDQMRRMPSLIWFFAGRTSHFVGFVVWWLIS